MKDKRLEKEDFIRKSKMTTKIIMRLKSRIFA